jgi:hypothetical protein
MNPSQLLAWLICLGLAFFAAALSVYNSYGLARLDRRFTEVERVATDQMVLLSDIGRILEQIERHLRAAPQDPGSEAAWHASGTAATPEADAAARLTPSEQQSP